VSTGEGSGARNGNGLEGKGSESDKTINKATHKPRANYWADLARDLDKEVESKGEEGKLLFDVR